MKIELVDIVLKELRSIDNICSDYQRKNIAEVIAESVIDYLDEQNKPY